MGLSHSIHIYSKTFIFVSIFSLNANATYSPWKHLTNDVAEHIVGYESECKNQTNEIPNCQKGNFLINKTNLNNNQIEEWLFINNAIEDRLAQFKKNKDFWQGYSDFVNKKFPFSFDDFNFSGNKELEDNIKLTNETLDAITKNEMLIKATEDFGFYPDPFPKNGECFNLKDWSELRGKNNFVNERIKFSQSNEYKNCIKQKDYWNKEGRKEARVKLEKMNDLLYSKAPILAHPKFQELIDKTINNFESKTKNLKQEDRKNFYLNDYKQYVAKDFEKINTLTKASKDLIENINKQELEYNTLKKKSENWEKLIKDSSESQNKNVKDLNSWSNKKYSNEIESALNDYSMLSDLIYTTPEIDNLKNAQCRLRQRIKKNQDMEKVRRYTTTTLLAAGGFLSSGLLTSTASLSIKLATMAAVNGISYTRDIYLINEKVKECKSKMLTANAGHNVKDYRDCDKELTSLIFITIALDANSLFSIGKSINSSNLLDLGIK